MAMIGTVVVDAAGFINGAPLGELADEIVTLREVVAEIRDKAARHRIYTAPYEMTYLEPDLESIARITDMARKTGDVGALSSTDVKVLALTYMLEVEKAGGSQHLRYEPTTKKTTEFYDPKKQQELGEGLEKIVGFCSQEEDDDEGWITPENLSAKTAEMKGGGEDDSRSRERVAVACLTSDFAMQNVLVQMGLNVSSASGKIITEAKTWILRCTACFATTPRMEKIFCPKCGNKTLKRVSVTLNPDGTQQIHISSRYQLSAKGTKFPLPMPRGGKHAVGPLLCEDQSGAKHQQSRLARSKTKAMNEDYIFGAAPFSKNDVTSKSAMMGVGHSKYYWEHKNPNAVGKKTGNRKKKNRI